MESIDHAILSTLMERIQEGDLSKTKEDREMLVMLYQTLGEHLLSNEEGIKN